jgi:hypothetical protein
MEPLLPFGVAPHLDLAGWLGEAEEYFGPFEGSQQERLG